MDCIITGGESGPGARPADPDWFRSIRDQCDCRGIAFFHKQNGGTGRDKGSHLLDGVERWAWPQPVAQAQNLLGPKAKAFDHSPPAAAKAPPDVRLPPPRGDPLGKPRC